MKHLKKDLLFLFIVVVSIGVMYFTINIITNNSNGRKKEILKNREYKGIISNKRMQKEETFYIKADKGEIKIIAVDWGDRETKSYSWEYAEVGDSIIKPKDQLRIIIKKKDGTSKSFPYLY